MVNKAAKKRQKTEKRNLERLEKMNSVIAIVSNGLESLIRQRGGPTVAEKKELLRLFFDEPVSISQYTHDAMNAVFTERWDEMNTIATDMRPIESSVAAPDPEARLSASL